MSMFNKEFILFIFLLLISSVAVAHTDGIYNPSANSVGDTQGIDSNSTAGGGTTFQGAGNVVSGATAWVSCSRVYQLSLASTATSLCDLKDATTGTVAICTLRGSTTGFVDLTGSYCAGSLTPAAACAAAAGGSCVVSKAYDQTGNGWDAVQATLSAMPALTFAALNSLPCITFVGASSQKLQSAGGIGSATVQPFDFSVVAKRTTVAFGGIVSWDVNHVGIDATSTASTWAVFAGSLGNFTVSDSAFHAVQGIVNSASSAGYVDGVSTTGLNAGVTGVAGADKFTLGVLNGAFVTGTICEAGSWNTGAWNLTTQSNMNANQHGANGYNF